MNLRNVISSVLLVLFTSAALAQVQADAGLVNVESANSASDTLTKLEAAIKGASMKVFTRIDHAAAANEVGSSMPTSTIVIFGNPKVGSPNMVKKPTLAIDLPLKALVWQDASGKVFVTYNSGAYVLGTIFARHGLNPPVKAQQDQEAMLSGLATSATK